MASSSSRKSDFSPFQFEKVLVMPPETEVNKSQSVAVVVRKQLLMLAGSIATTLLIVTLLSTQLLVSETAVAQTVPLASTLKAFRQTFEASNNSQFLWLDCDELSTVGDVKYLAGGWTKAVFTATYHQTDADTANVLALKTLLQNGTQIQRCLLATPPTTSDYNACYNQAKQKLVKEALLLSQLNHPGIVKLHGYCDLTRSEQSEKSADSAILVTELGQPFNLLDLLQMSWTERLKISISLLELLDYFAQRALVLNDLRQSQFVLVDGQLKLSDLDDINHVSRSRSNEDYYLLQTAPWRTNASAVQQADGHNLQSAYRHFFKFMLTHGAPRSLRSFARAFTSSVAEQQYSSRFYAALLRDKALDHLRRLPSVR